jgi:hypothetical protein
MRTAMGCVPFERIHDDVRGLDFPEYWRCTCDPQHYYPGDHNASPVPHRKAGATASTPRANNLDDGG